jgi:signal transduction histidine kinase
VHVRLYTEDQVLVLCVSDSGLGIPQSEIQTIWDKFHRVTRTEGRSIEGTGIGLSLTLELVKIHKGEVRVDSTPGQGRCANLFFCKNRAT